MMTGRELKERRISRTGLSQREVAQQVGVSQATLSRIECERGRRVDMRLLQKIEEALRSCAPSNISEQADMTYESVRTVMQGTHAVFERLLGVLAKDAHLEWRLLEAIQTSQADVETGETTFECKILMWHTASGGASQGSRDRREVSASVTFPAHEESNDFSRLRKALIAALDKAYKEFTGVSAVEQIVRETFRVHAAAVSEALALKLTP